MNQLMIGSILRVVFSVIAFRYALIIGKRKEFDSFFSVLEYF